MTPNVEQLNIEQLLLELEQKTEVLNKEMRYRQQAEFLSHQHIETLESKNKEIRLFANIAAHELQNPLESLEAGLLTLKSHHTHPMSDVQDIQDSITILENSVDRLRHLINGYLDFAFIQIDAASFELISINPLLDEALQNIAEIIQEHKANIHYDRNLFSTCPNLLGNQELLRCVFEELISNSIHYCDKPQIEIDIAFETQPGLCLLSIKDNGKGIHPKYFEQIFWVIKPDQASGGYKRGSIGLAITKKIIEHHGGKIWVSSNIEGGGSTFYISLPIPPQH